MKLIYEYQRHRLWKIGKPRKFTNRLNKREEKCMGYNELWEGTVGTLLRLTCIDAYIDTNALFKLSISVETVLRFFLKLLSS